MKEGEAGAESGTATEGETAASMSGGEEVLGEVGDEEPCVKGEAGCDVVLGGTLVEEEGIRQSWGKEGK